MVVSVALNVVFGTTKLLIPTVMQHFEQMKVLMLEVMLIIMD